MLFSNIGFSFWFVVVKFLDLSEVAGMFDCQFLQFLFGCFWHTKTIRTHI